MKILRPFVLEFARKDRSLHRPKVNSIPQCVSLCLSFLNRSLGCPASSGGCSIRRGEQRKQPIKFLFPRELEVESGRSLGCKRPRDVERSAEEEERARCIREGARRRRRGRERDHRMDRFRAPVRLGPLDFIKR